MQMFRNILVFTQTVLAAVFSRSSARCCAGARLACFGFFAAVGIAAFAPAAWATPIAYGFTVSDFSGPLAGNTYHGTFSYDSSIVVPGDGREEDGLLTALDFTFNGVTYDASMANTGWLWWDVAGNLVHFAFGTNCFYGACGVDLDTDPDHRTWFLVDDVFAYGKSRDQVGGNVGRVHYAPINVSVPEPGALGLFGFGLLLVGMAGIRRVAGRSRIGKTHARLDAPTGAS